MVKWDKVRGNLLVSPGAGRTNTTSVLRWSKKDGNQRRDLLIHTGCLDDHLRGVLGALVRHPASRGSEVVLAGQVHRKKHHDVCLHFDGSSVAAGAARALRHRGGAD